MMRELGGGFAFSAAWLLCWAAASVAWRLLKGKPVFYRRPSAVRFREWNGSGNSCRNWFTRLAGANGCLVVQVTDAGLDTTRSSRSTGCSSRRSWGSSTASR
jgi:hypothetical protein